MKKLGFIGCGNMGEAMLAGAIKSSWAAPSDIILHTHTLKRMSDLQEAYGICQADSNADVAAQCRLLVLAIKPHLYSQVISEIKESLHPDSILVGISSGYSIQKIQSLSGQPERKIVRAMPNTPAMVGCGMTGLCYSSQVLPAEKELVLDFFRSFGDATEIKESLMTAVIAVSGSAPAFVYMVIEALAQGAILEGLPAPEAYRFAAKTVEGAAQMVQQTGQHPGILRDAVCSAGGTTIEGVIALEENGFKGALLQAMQRTAAKGKKMETLA